VRVLNALLGNLSFFIIFTEIEKQIEGALLRLVASLTNI